MNWTFTKPFEPGMYLFKARGQWPIHLIQVDKGNWRNSENPEWLYGSGEPVEQRDGIWYGPIPKPDKNFCS
jgi:hypothetical protein